MKNTGFIGSIGKDQKLKIIVTPANSLLLGDMPRGCKLCIRGAKLVLFLTGLCAQACYYCPLSEKRWGRDVVYANERPVKSTRDIIEEAKLMDALGTGITGGDPSLRFRRTLRYIQLLKRKFGRRHHIHMYCGGKLSQRQLHKLKHAGLDEIRFHTWSVVPVEMALRTGLQAGVEIPAIPNEYARIKSFFRDLDEIGCGFVNLNELEFSDTNLSQLKGRGFEIKSDESMAVKGSEETAVRVLKWAAANTSLNIHYCPSALKDAVQLRNRLRRMAKNVARRHEVVTKEGLLVKGIIQDLPLDELVPLRRCLMLKYGIPPEFIVIDRQKRRIELHWLVAKKLAKLEPELKFALIEEYPTYDRLKTTLIPFSR
jgi:pyruvate formate-lyase activating enzyme-like uncharacterized protein